MSYQNFQQRIKQNIHRQHQNFKKMQKFIDDLHQKCLNLSKINQKKILNDYKNQLQRTKVQFNRLKNQRNQDVIYAAVVEEKKELERECAVSIKKSLKIAKVYQNLNMKWRDMHTNQEQMVLERTFLGKEIKKAEKLHEKLTNQLNQLKFHYQQKILQRSQRKPTLLCPLPTRSDILGPLSSNNLITKKQLLTIYPPPPPPTQFHKNHYKTQQLKNQTQLRLRNRLEAKTSYLNGLNFQQSALERILEGYQYEYEYERCVTDKEKIGLFERILGDVGTKEILYGILFGKEEEEGEGEGEDKENFGEVKKSQKRKLKSKLNVQDNENIQ